MIKLLLEILSVLLMTIYFSACSQSNSKTDKNSTELRTDTTNTAILEFKRARVWIFDSSYKSTELTQYDLTVIDSFQIKAVTEFNDWQKKTNPDNAWMIDLKKLAYRKQLIAVTNQTGEKEVWVNCFCHSVNADWKSNLVDVQDGGTCYFNFKINLTNKIYFNFRVNSSG
jgi:hypothetical protein